MGKLKILIIGASGKTGIELVKQGLERGHEVTALVRNPADFKLSDPRLKVLQGNVLDPESLQRAISGQDAILSALGHKRFIIPSSILSEGTKNMIQAMEKSQVKRLVCITSLGVNDSRFKLGLYYTLFTIPFILLFYFLDKAKQEKLIMNSDLDWTIVRPGQLTNGKKRAKIHHGTHVGNYILTKMISRASVANFMLNQLEDDFYLKKAVGIIN
ncbi:NAD(P)-dependent oxidoreductase [Algoriphagus mannitolivorans]|uniref:NAD(P)-dependent oxidoreductase n=1 Tax=Algoriphagus mannitolivorans TaxID=226504 RepID=UPI000421C5E2|nr:SDR family oxidoreductase [Algoriphagus mannitolivorans]